MGHFCPSDCDLSNLFDDTAHRLCVKREREREKERHIILSKSYLAACLSYCLDTQCHISKQTHWPVSGRRGVWSGGRPCSRFLKCFKTHCVLNWNVTGHTDSQQIRIQWNLIVIFDIHMYSDPFLSCQLSNCSTHKHGNHGNMKIDLSVNVNIACTWSEPLSFWLKPQVVTVEIVLLYSIATFVISPQSRPKWF